MKRKPGQRLTADQIISRATLWSIIGVGLMTVIATLIMALSGIMHIVPSVVLGGAVVCVMNAVSLIVSHIGDRVTSLTTVSAIGGYVVKLGLIIGTFISLIKWDIFLPNIVAISIICGIMIWISVMGFIVIRTEGPEIEE
ncbi:hypothetical protein [Arcanobacterium buesumense]|uniref:ATP synthase protein I n=1 Tax=Arcanobacterium buesumense TaxID=2722751 RepID=A0A6H2EKF7_9ACTO|nr:hypothetical protein [Arcanobacterium buesumense]QJC21369.1 hypothetical protein HC352_01755 [Arcanobacterium buesumense]